MTGKKTPRVFFSSAYGGGVKCTAIIGEVEHVVDLQELSENLEKQIQKKGYTTSITNRQKYPRIHIKV